MIARAGSGGTTMDTALFFVLVLVLVGVTLCSRSTRKWAFGGAIWLTMITIWSEISLHSTSSIEYSANREFALMLGRSTISLLVVWVGWLWLKRMSQRKLFRWRPRKGWRRVMARIRYLNPLLLLRHVSF